MTTSKPHHPHSHWQHHPVNPHLMARRPTARHLQPPSSPPPSMHNVTHTSRAEAKTAIWAQPADGTALSAPRPVQHTAHRVQSSLSPLRTASIPCLLQLSTYQMGCPRWRSRRPASRAGGRSTSPGSAAVGGRQAHRQPGQWPQPTMTQVTGHEGEGENESVELGMVCS